MKGIHRWQQLEAWFRRAFARVANRFPFASKELPDSPELVRFALETSRIGSWDLDPVDRTFTRSLEHDRIFGYEKLLPRWTHQMLLDHVIPEDRATVEERFNEVMTTQVDWSVECRIRRNDGAVRWIWIKGKQSGFIFAYD